MDFTPLIMACVMNASQLYGVPPAGIYAVLAAEGGRTDAVSPNDNGSYDIGPMQVNSLWLAPLAQGWAVDRATAEAALRSKPCTNIAVGTWILADCIQRRGDFWQGVGCYHAPNNAELAGRYISRVAGKATALFGPDVFRGSMPIDTSGSNTAGADRP